MKIITKLSSFQNLFLSKSFVAFFSLLMTLLFSSSSFGQTVVTVGGGATVTCPATPTATWTTPPAGVSFSNWSRGAGVTCGTASTALSGNGFNTANASASYSANKYYSVTITADATHNFSLNSIVWSTAVSNGPANFDILYSNNGGTVTAFGSTGTNTTSNTFTGTVNVLAGTSIVIYLVPSGTNAAGRTVRWVNGSTITVTATSAVASPTVTTTAATSLSTTGAIFNGTVDANTLSTAITFEYGTTVSYGTSVGANPSSLNTDTATAVDATVTGLSYNTLYNYRTVGTVSGTPTNGNNITFYTLANTPSAVTVGNPQLTTLDVAIATTDGNPASTEYAIQETTGGLYVQADGSLGATAVWQTASVWATKTVIGLTGNTAYTFQAKARNGANTETVAFGGATSGTTLAIQTVDWCNMQPLVTNTFSEGGSTLVFARVYEGGITNFAGEGTAIDAWIGYSSTNGTPDGTWTWVAAPYFGDDGSNNDEYSTTIGSALTPGVYYVASRFSINGGPFVYGGVNNNIWSSTADSAVMTVTSNVVDYANVQFPTSGTITEGDAFTVYAQTYEAGVTPGTGQGADITAEIGYSTSNIAPDGTWTWIAATHNPTEVGNNDEYQANIASGLAAGTYYYASRFQKAGSSEYVYGGTNGSPWSTSGVLTVNALGTPTATAGTNVLQQTFTANWDAAAGATSYELDVATDINFSGTNTLVGWSFPVSGTTVTPDVSTAVNSAYTITTNGGTISSSAGLTTQSPSANAWASGANTKYWQIDFNTTNNTNINVSAVQRSSGTGPRDFKIQYKIGAGSWADTGVNVTVANDFTAGVSSTVLPASCNNQPLVSVRWIMTSDTNVNGTLVSAGTSRIDNVLVTGDFATFVSGSPFTIAAPTTTYNVTGLAENTTYYYRVRAVNGTATSGNSGVITVATKPTTVVWNAGWSNTTGPDQDIEASIEGPYNSDTDGEFTAKKVTVNVGGSLTIAADTNITVVNEVENTLTDADFVIENDGNLIQTNDVTNTGAITVQRMSAPIARFDYTLWSSPVAGQLLLDFSPLTLVTPTSRFYSFDPTLTASGGGSGAYVSITNPDTTPFAEGNGYLIRASNLQPAVAAPWLGTFKGVPNNGNVSITTTSGSWYAIGNPYPSTIDADEFITSNSLTQPLYFWRKTNGASNPSYATYTLVGQTGVGTPNTAGGSTITPDGIIAAGQGFLTQAPSSSLVFTNALRNGDFSTQFLRSGSDNKSRVWLNLSNNEGFVNQILVGYMTAATTGIDAAMDGRFFENNIPTQLSSLINGEEFAVQGRPEFTASDVVALGFKAQTEGNYTIAIDHVDGLFADGQEVFLKDNVTNTVHNLTNEAYSFTASAGASNARFEIVYQSSSTLATENPVLNENTVVIYKQNQDLVVNTGSIEMKNVKVYDIQGRLLVEQKDINATTTKLAVGINNQVLIVKVTSKDNAVVTKKVIN